ncbi:MAG: diacylglycerol kinase family protein [Planctomycetaceae bacterium]
MSGDWVAIQRNPRSGSGRGRRELVELCRTLRARGLKPRLFSDRSLLDARLADTDQRQGLLALVAAGGDGTVVDLANRHPNLPLAVMPLGTENLLARYLGMPRSGRGVADVIAARQTRRIDMGRAGGRLFTLVASVGLDASVVHRLDRARSGNITHRSYIKPILWGFRTYDYPRLQVRIDDDPEPIEGAEILVSNLPAYGFGLKVGKTAKENDGRLVVTVLQRGSTFQMIRYLSMLFRGTHERAADVKVATARRVRVECVDSAREGVPVQIDGDPAGLTPVAIECLPGALEVFVP